MTNSPFDIEDNAAYQRWRSHKLAAAAQYPAHAGPVEISDLAQPTRAEQAELMSRCTASNAAFYQCAKSPDEPDRLRTALRGFCDHLGLRIAEKHRSAGQGGIVALTLSENPKQARYIPYTSKAMNWHTDGYYNPPEATIRAMVLHCAHPATDGGENRFFDPEIAYIRLRDKDPALIAALMHPKAMEIPENREPDGGLRPVSIGPVFSHNNGGGHLHMRYTARSRSIHWRDDALTRQAVAYLAKILGDGDEFMQTVKFTAGSGILCNNSLHARTAFDPAASKQQARLMFRIRFHNRVAEV